MKELELVDEAAEFVRNNKNENFVLSLIPDKNYRCHNGRDIDYCTNNIITKLSRRRAQSFSWWL